MTQTVNKMSAAQMKIALNKAWKKIEELEKNITNLAEANSRIETLKSTIEFHKETINELNLQITDYRESLINCSEAHTKLKSDNTLLIKKLTIAWDVMGKLSK